MDCIDESNLMEYLFWSECGNSTQCIGSLDKICQQISSPSLSLVGLCCTKVIRHFKSLNKEIMYVWNHIYFPTNLHSLLFREAILQDVPETAGLLISMWPTRSFSVIDVIPYPESICMNVTRRNGPRISTKYPGVVDEHLNTALKAVLFVIRLLLDILKTGITRNLRVLDLCSWILSDKMTSEIIRQLVNFSTEERLLHDYHIMLECEIRTSSTYDELMSFLESNRKSQEIKIHLHFKKLELSCLKRYEICRLLQLINPTELIGLSIRHFPSDFMETIFKNDLKSLIALSVVDTGDPTPKKMLPLHLLPRLRRLGLNKFHGRLETCVPQSTLRQLDHLNIYALPAIRGIPEIGSDIRYMISVPLRLSELNLTRHIFITSHLNLWHELFQSLAPTLRILILGTCEEYEDDDNAIFDLVLELHNLVYLDLVDNYFSMDEILQYLPALGSLPQLKKISMDYPYGKFTSIFYDEDSSIVDDGITYATCRAVQREISKKKLIPTKIEWRE